MRPLIVISLCAVLGACGNVVSTWEKPGGTPEEEQAIYKKCVYEAESASQEGLTSESMRKERVRKLRDMCLEANGMVRIKQETVPAK